MIDVRAKLRDLANADRRGAVWCAALCASTVRNVMPVEAYPALRLAFLWSQGVQVSRDRLREAARDAYSAAIDAYTATHFARASAAYSAAYAAYTATHIVARASAHSVEAAYASAYVSHGTDVARGIYAARIADLIASQITPLDLPGYSVLGDWLQERCVDDRVGTLGGSLGWARQRRLRWWDPAERYAAERRIAIPGEYIAAHRRTP